MRAPAAFLLAIAGLLAPVACARASDGSLEAAVKATYLYKLAPFVEWPAAPASAAPSSFAICVQADEAFAALVQKATAGQEVVGRPIAVHSLARLDGSSGCQIAYVGGSAAQSQDAALKSLDAAGVLTVTDEDRGPARGVVHLLLSGGRVRFDIDRNAAAREGLTISSKLLSLALHVRGR